MKLPRLSRRRKVVVFAPFGRPRLGLSDTQVAGSQRPTGGVLMVTRTHGVSKPDRAIRSRDLLATGDRVRSVNPATYGWTGTILNVHDRSALPYTVKWDGRPITCVCNSRDVRLIKELAA